MTLYDLEEIQFSYFAPFFCRYRHYGVYLTHEEDQLVDGDDVLRNPVVVLDKNSESYINLRYPIHSKEESELTKGLTPKVTKT